MSARTTILTLCTAGALAVTTIPSAYRCRTTTVAGNAVDCQATVTTPWPSTAIAALWGFGARVRIGPH